jgi:hypothetical protein
MWKGGLGFPTTLGGQLRTRTHTLTAVRRHKPAPHIASTQACKHLKRGAVQLCTPELGRHSLHGDGRQHR